MLTPITQEPKAYNVDIGPLKQSKAVAGSYSTHGTHEYDRASSRIPHIECRMYIRIPIGGRGPALNLCWGYGSRVGSRIRQ